MNPVKTPRRTKDPIVDEVRAVREAMDAEVGHDIAKLAERAQRVGEEYCRTHGITLVKVPPES